VTLPRAAAEVTLLLSCPRATAIDWLQARTTPVVVGEEIDGWTVVRTYVDANWLPDGTDIGDLMVAASDELMGVVVASLWGVRGGSALWACRGDDAVIADFEDVEQPPSAGVEHLCRLLGHDEVAIDAGAVMLSIYDESVGYAGALHARRQLAQMLGLPFEFTDTTPPATHQVVVSRQEQADMLPAVAAGAKAPIWALTRGPWLLVQMDDETAPSALAAVALGTFRTPAVLMELSQSHVELAAFRKGRDVVLRWPHTAVPLNITSKLARDFGVPDLADRLGADNERAATQLAHALGLADAEAAALLALAQRQDLQPQVVALHLVALLRLPPEVTVFLGGGTRLSAFADGTRTGPAPLRQAIMRTVAQASGPAWWFTWWFATVYAFVGIAVIVAAAAGWVSGGLRTFVILGWAANLMAYGAFFVARRRQRAPRQMEQPQ